MFKNKSQHKLIIGLLLITALTGLYSFENLFARTSETSSTFHASAPKIVSEKRLRVAKDGTIILKQIVLDKVGYVLIFSKNTKKPEDVAGYHTRPLAIGKNENTLLNIDGTKIKKYAWLKLFYDNGNGYFDQDDMNYPLSQKNAQKRIMILNKKNGKPQPPLFFSTQSPQTQYDDLKPEELEKMKNYPPPGEFPFSETNTKSFFGDDERAKAIRAGQVTFDMREYTIFDINTDNGLPAPYVTSVRDNYGEKIISALTMLGYLNLNSQRCKSGEVKFDTLCQFQRRHGLPESNIIDAETLRLIDEEIREVEKRDREIARDFPCYEYIIPAPQYAPSKDHLVALYATAIKAFPEKYRIKTKKQCFNNQAFHVVGGKKPWDPPKICPTEYWLNLNVDSANHICQPENRYFKKPPDDYGVLMILIHEYSHSLDVYKYTLTIETEFLPEWVDARKFYEISWNTSDFLWLNDVEKLWKPKPGISVELPPEDPVWNDVKQHFFSYGLGWSNVKHPGYYTIAEDFAVTMGMYINHGKVFRDYLKNKLPLQKKYQWIKKNIFQGKEFNTGDENYKTYSPDLYGGGGSDAGGYFWSRPDDYVLKYYELPF